MDSQRLPPRLCLKRPDQADPDDGSDQRSSLSVRDARWVASGEIAESAHALVTLTGAIFGA